MMVSKLYLKIFFAFVAVLIVAEIIVYSVIFSGRIHPPFFFSAVQDTVTVGRIVQTKMEDVPVSRRNLEETVAPVLELLAAASRKSIWLSDTAGRMLTSSFEGPTPHIGEYLVPVNMPTDENVKFYKVDAEDYRSIFVTTPITLHDGTQLVLNVLFGKHPRRNEQAFFLKTFLLLTVLGAIFIIPVSRRITRPVLQLAESAERLGKGDFSQRVSEKGNDEVALLAKKFNRMSEGLEKMVMAGKSLTAHLSHELRSPLARMRMSIQMLTEKVEQGKSLENDTLLEGIQEEIVHMDELIGSMLELSKLDMQEPPAMTDQVNLADDLRAMLGRYAIMMEKKGITAVEEIEPVPELACSARGMGVLLDNIVGNAVKYTDEGGRLTVALRMQDHAIHLRVCNTHEPLSEPELKSIFEPFQRLGSGTDGSGLGLFAARKIVGLHKGEIWAENESGVCINIRLPFS